MMMIDKDELEKAARRMIEIWDGSKGALLSDLLAAIDRLREVLGGEKMTMPSGYCEFTVYMNEQEGQELLRLLAEFGPGHLDAVKPQRTPRDIAIEKAAQKVVATHDEFSGRYLGEGRRCECAACTLLRAALEVK